MFVEAFNATLGVLVACGLFLLAVSVAAIGCSVLGVMWRARHKDDGDDGDGEL